MNILKNRIAELRKNKKASQEDVAKALGITRQAISLYERGEHEPKLETWQRLADYFHVPVSYLKGYTAYTCARCGGYFIPDHNARRKNIKCCPYCMNPYFEEDNLQKNRGVNNEKQD